MKGGIVHIVSDYRSGSTLLDQLLDAHPMIRGVGEIIHLRAYALRDRALHDPAYALDCTCGEALANCPFWRQVAANLDKPLATLRMSPRFSTRTGGHSLSRACHRTMRRLTQGLLSAPESLLANLLIASGTSIRDNGDLYTAIFALDDTRFIADSSKELARYEMLANAFPANNRTVLLCRDYRAVAYSKQNRGVDALISARSWANRVFETEKIVSRLPQSSVFRLRYEDLCTSPENEMQRLCEFLSLPYSSQMVDRTSADCHQIGGSPSKLQNDRQEIKLDTAYRQAFSADQLKQMRDSVKGAAAIWGYE